jgi:DNA-binding CsgD family transcriptional regulator
VASDSSASDQPIAGQLAEAQVSQRQLFVGRERELRQLQAAFGAAAKGDGALTLLVGEPGIGKTALSDQLCRFVSASGGLPLVGHCYEEGSFRPPYQPFVEVFGTYLQPLDADAVHAELGSRAADLARIVPMLRDRLHVSPPPPGDPEEDRWRLLQAATDLLRNASAKQPLLVVLEDLHDADRGTLDLLLYLARNLHGARILVIGTYRDVEVDRAHPLSAALTELHRASNVARVQLHGLSTNEVHRLLAETSKQTIPHPFAELVQRQTEGNPLFVHETLRFVIDTGLMEQRDGALRRVGDQTLAGRIPEGLRDAVGKRLSRLSESTNRALSVASVIGREFQLDVLRQVLARPEEELEAALEEASASAIIEEHSAVGSSIVYRFSHAFFRQTLYDEIVAPRRIRLHQQVAHALEEVYARRLDEHAAELAEHFSFYSDTLNLANAVQYGEVAARQAAEVFAYGEAARQLERALVVQDLVDPDDRAKRCDLLLSLGEALYPAGENERVSTHVAPDAFRLAEGIGDRSRAFHASRLALDSLFARGVGYIASRPEYLTWAERATRYAAPASVERCHADVALATARFGRGQFAEARELRLEALALARSCGDPEALFRAASFHIGQLDAPRHWDERLALVEEFAAWPRDGVSGTALHDMLRYSAKALLAQGERARAENLSRQLRELAERTHAATVRMYTALADVQLAVVDGHLEDAWARCNGIAEQADELGMSFFLREGGFLDFLLAPSLYLGREHRWLEAFDQGIGPATVTQPDRQSLGSIRRTAARALCLAQIGRIEEARTLLVPVLDAIEGLDDEFPFGSLARLLESAVAVEHRAAAQALAGRLACVAHLNGDTVAVRTCFARHLGDAAALVGNPTAARGYYAQALESAGKIRFRPELALTHLRLAELLRKEAGDATRHEALQHLDLAVPELRDMKMQPALERALALRETLAPAATVAAATESASDGLTARERQIASLMASGLSNHDIAEQLVISEGTVEVHVKHILGKLGFRSRAQVPGGWLVRALVEAARPEIRGFPPRCHET